MSEPEFTVAQKLFIILTWKANGMSMGAAYESWSDFQARKNLTEYWKDSNSVLQNWKFGIEDFKQLTLDELRSLGFRNWDKNYWLLPLWLVPQVNHSEGWFDLWEKPTVFNEDTDLDVRGGCIAICFKYDSAPILADPREQSQELPVKIDPEAEAFINGMPGGEVDEYLEGISQRDEPGMSAYLNVEDMAAAHKHMLIHPLRDDEYQ